MTYGRSIHKALKLFHIDPETWVDLAADRPVWRETLRLGQPAIRRSVRDRQAALIRRLQYLH
jgi:hypothetical protein